MRDIFASILWVKKWQKNTIVIELFTYLWTSPLAALLLEKEDFDFLPIFAREGASWGKLNRVFEGDLETIISEINQAIAA